MAKYTRKQAIELHNSFKALTKMPFKPKTAVRLNKNVNMLAPELTVMHVATEQISKIEGLKEYEEKRLKICTTLAAKGTDGEPMTNESRYVFPTQDIALQAQQETAVLAKEYKTLLEKKAEFEKQLEILLDEEVEYELLTIRIEDTDEKVLPTVLSPIMDLLED